MDINQIQNAINLLRKFDPGVSPIKVLQQVASLALSNQIYPFDLLVAIREYPNIEDEDDEAEIQARVNITINQLQDALNKFQAALKKTSLPGR